MMPGGYSVPYRQIKNFRQQKPFFVFDDDNKKIEIENSQDMIVAYNYYYTVWDNCKEFGLPHGGGWADHPPWLPDFLKYYNRIFREIETYRAKRN